jgi:putative hemolysin
MRHFRKGLEAFVITALAGWLMAACTGSQDEPSKGGKADEMRTMTANPAATKCVNDGYRLEPIMKGGVSIDYLCINPKTGKKCEAWKYFRNECKLDE